MKMNNLRRIILILVGIHIVSFPWGFHGVSQEKIFINIVIIFLILFSTLVPVRIFVTNLYVRYLSILSCIVAIGLNGHQAYIDFNEVYGPDIGGIIFKFAYIILLAILLVNIGTNSTKIKN